MYPNRFHRTTPKRNQTISPNSHPQFFIRRSEIAFDKRVRYIEQVCQVLIESRFGACLAEPVTMDLSTRPDLEPVQYDYLFDDEQNETLPEYALSNQGRACSFASCSSCLCGEKISGTHNQTTALPPNQGRGSP